MPKLNVILLTALTVALGVHGSAVRAETVTDITANTLPDPLPPLHTGDLVRVRSGGPLMTVASVTGDQVNCSWTDWLGGLRSESFPVSVLQGPIVPPIPQHEIIR